jgi:putative addiction module CopG family antidote
MPAPCRRRSSAQFPIHIAELGEFDYSSAMEITLPPDLKAYVEQRVQGGGFTSANELITEALRRKMEEDAWMEQKVLEAEQGELTPLTREDLQSMRRLIREPHATRAS